MTESEMNDTHMPEYRASPSNGAVMTFCNLWYASFSATISPQHARMFALHLLRAADDAEAMEQAVLQDAARCATACTETEQ